MMRPAVRASTSNSVSPRLTDHVLPDCVHSTSVEGSVVAADVSEVVVSDVGAVVVGVVSVVVGDVGGVTGVTPDTVGVTEAEVVGETGGVTLGAPVVEGEGVVVVVLGVTVGATTGTVDVVAGAGAGEPLSPQLMNAAERPVTSQREPAGEATSGRKRMAGAYCSRLADENARGR